MVPMARDAARRVTGQGDEVDGMHIA